MNPEFTFACKAAGFFTSLGFFVGVFLVTADETISTPSSIHGFVYGEFDLLRGQHLAT